jgi:hypothetical protein
LSTPASANKSLHARAERLTDILAGPDATLTRREHAAAIADAQIDLFRVRATKISILEGIAGETHASLERLVKLFCYIARFGLDRAIERLVQDHISEEPLPREGMVRGLEVFRRALPELLKLERYEKRALSRIRDPCLVWIPGINGVGRSSSRLVEDITLRRIHGRRFGKTNPISAKVFKSWDGKEKESGKSRLHYSASLDTP